MNRAGITRCIRRANGAASARWKDRESPGKSLRKGWSARARGSKLSRRYFCPYNEVGSRPADSFEASVEQRRFFFCLLQPSFFLFYPAPTVFFETRYHARRLETELRGKTVVPRFIRIYAIRSQCGCYALKYDNARIYSVRDITKFRIDCDVNWKSTFYARQRHSSPLITIITNRAELQLQIFIRCENSGITSLVFFRCKKRTCIS